MKQHYFIYFFYSNRILINTHLQQNFDIRFKLPTLITHKLKIVNVTINLS